MLEDLCLSSRISFLWESVYHNKITMMQLRIMSNKRENTIAMSPLLKLQILPLELSFSIVRLFWPLMPAPLIIFEMRQHDFTYSSLCFNKLSQEVLSMRKTVIQFLLSRIYLVATQFNSQFTTLLNNHDMVFCLTGKTCRKAVRWAL